MFLSPGEPAVAEDRRLRNTSWQKCSVSFCWVRAEIKLLFQVFCGRDKQQEMVKSLEDGGADDKRL